MYMLFVYRLCSGFLLAFYAFLLVGCSTDDTYVFGAAQVSPTTGSVDNAPYKLKLEKAYSDILTDCSFHFSGLRGWEPNEQLYWKKFISPYIANRAYHFMKHDEFVAIVFEAHGNTASVSACGFKWDANLDFEANTVVEKRKIGFIPGTKIPNYDSNYKKQDVGEQNFNIPPMVVRWCNFRLPVAPEDLGRRAPTVQVQGICNVNEDFAVNWLEAKREKAKRRVKARN